MITVVSPGPAQGVLFIVRQYQNGTRVNTSGQCGSPPSPLLTATIAKISWLLMKKSSVFDDLLLRCQEPAQDGWRSRQLRHCCVIWMIGDSANEAGGIQYN